jgi:hypothetical protein
MERRRRRRRMEKRRWRMEKRRWRMEDEDGGAAKSTRCGSGDGKHEQELNLTSPLYLTIFGTDFSSCSSSTGWQR